MRGSHAEVSLTCEKREARAVQKLVEKNVCCLWHIITYFYGESLQ